MPVRRRLLLLAFSLLVPAVIACGIAVLLTYTYERERSEENLLRTTQALAQSLDREINIIVRRLETLATSPSLQQGDFDGFRQQASRAVQDDGMWIVVEDKDGQQAVNTLQPVGEPLHNDPPGYAPRRVLDRAMETAAPAVSDLFIGRVSGQPTLAIFVPVFGKNGEVICGLAMGFLPRTLQEIVSPGNLPQSWLVAAFDASLNIVARSVKIDQFIGQKPVPELAEAMGGTGHGVMDALSREGNPTRVAYAQSPKYGWHLAIGVPKAELAATAYQSILLFLGIALALLTGGAVLAAQIGRRISHAITSLVPAANGLGKGGRVVLQDTGVLEVDQVSSALVHTGDTLRSTEAERRRAEEALTAAKERAEEILSSITDGFYALDRDWRFTYINGRAQEILGKSPNQVLGIRFFDLFPQVEGTIVHENYRSVMALRQPRQFDFISPILKRWTAFSVYPAGDGGIAVYFRDISAEKTAEAELVSAKDAAERANYAKTQFLAAASHDLRQPVQSLFFFHEALTAKLKDHPCRQLVSSMDSGLSALKNLLDGLLDISRLHAGAVDVHKTVFPLAGLLDRLETEYAVRADAQGVILRTVRSTAWVRSDMAQLERILRNLLENALKYSGSGGTVLLGCRRSGKTLRIEIVDTGPGIPQDKLETIFDEFVQLGNPERDRTKGLGLGLAIVRQLGRLLDHDITVRSQPGHGTRFSVSVPMAKAQRESTPRIAQVPAPASSGLALIVDDEALILLGLRSMLEGWGWEVMAASSGKEAARLVTGSSRPPDVIVADYRLRGGETGVNVIRDIHEICALSIPAMVLTGDTSPERIGECRKSGFRLMHKPVSSALLQAALGDMMRDGEKLRA